MSGRSHIHPWCFSTSQFSICFDEPLLAASTRLVTHGASSLSTSRYESFRMEAQDLKLPFNLSLIEVSRPQRLFSVYIYQPPIFRHLFVFIHLRTAGRPLTSAPTASERTSLSTSSKHSCTRSAHTHVCHTNHNLAAPNVIQRGNRGPGKENQRELFVLHENRISSSDRSSFIVKDLSSSSSDSSSNTSDTSIDVESRVGSQSRRSSSLPIPITSGHRRPIPPPDDHSSDVSQHSQHSQHSHYSHLSEMESPAGSDARAAHRPKSPSSVNSLDTMVTVGSF